MYNHVIMYTYHIQKRPLKFLELPSCILARTAPLHRRRCARGCESIQHGCLRFLTGIPTHLTDEASLFWGLGFGWLHHSWPHLGGERLARSRRFELDWSEPSEASVAKACHCVEVSSPRKHVLPESQNFLKPSQRTSKRDKKNVMSSQRRYQASSQSPSPRPAEVSTAIGRRGRVPLPSGPRQHH